MVNEHKITDGAEVVVGTDGTEAALRAVAWAATEARLRGVPLRIVHAAPYVASANEAGRHRATAIHLPDGNGRWSFDQAMKDTASSRALSIVRYLRFSRTTGSPSGTLAP